MKEVNKVLSPAPMSIGIEHRLMDKRDASPQKSLPLKSGTAYQASWRPAVKFTKRQSRTSIENG